MDRKTQRIFPGFYHKKKWFIGLVLLLIIGIFSSSFLSISVSSAPENSEEKTPSILFIMDDDYGGNCIPIIEIFSGYGWKITTAAPKKTIVGCSYVDHAEYEVDEILSENINYYTYDCISILPGEDHPNLIDDEQFFSVLQNANSSQIVISAWCKAVRLLAKANLLSGVNMTGSGAFIPEYESANGIFNLLSPPICDGNIITSVRSRFYREETCELIKSTVESNNLDPVLFSTYFGGDGDEEGSSASLRFLGDVCIDGAGDIITVGRTESLNFPVKNAYQASHGGGIDVVISKFHPNGTLVFSTFFGGSRNEWATGVSTNSQGEETEEAEKREEEFR